VWAVREIKSLNGFDSGWAGIRAVVKQLHHDSKFKGLIPAGVGSARDKITKKFNSEVGCAVSAMVELLHHDSKLEGLIPAGVGSGRYKITKKF
jgi:hypothetical protein